MAIKYFSSGSLHSSWSVDLMLQEQFDFQKWGCQSLIPFFLVTNIRKGKERKVAQLCPTLCAPVDCSLPGSSVHGISQARILEWVAIFFSQGSSWPRDWTYISCIAGGFCTAEPLSHKRHISDHSSERENFSRVGLRQQELTGQITREEEATGVRACKLNIKSCTHRVNSKRLD